MSGEEGYGFGKIIIIMHEFEYLLDIFCWILLEFAGVYIVMEFCLGIRSSRLGWDKLHKA
jgi:hypothetical protein